MSLRREKILTSAVLAIVLPPIFFGIEGLARGRATSAPGWMVTALDQAIPVTPAAGWLYVSWYPATAILGIAGRETFRLGWLAYVFALLVCCVGYVLVPIRMSRPVIDAGQGISASLLLTVYALDPPINVFPSFHAAVAGVLWLLRPRSRGLSIAVSAWMSAVCFACLLTKQHYLVDVVVGLVVGGMSVKGSEAVWHLWDEQSAEALESAQPVTRSVTGVTHRQGRVGGCSYFHGPLPGRER